ncbi:hypothetical protein [Halocatena halophila]|uniref:hypothetical protein n=1 Tax=Halocatena halophila TaxID=2814576 RepID=UPI002ED4A047
MNWAATNYDDSDWEQVELPASWEDHSGYTADQVFGWYRKTIEIPKSWDDYGNSLLLPLGKIDDVDRTFFNGTEIGKSGSIPADDFRTAWTEHREYPLSMVDVNFGEKNTIAIKVYDEFGGGGLYAGPLGPLRLRSNHP